VKCATFVAQPFPWPASIGILLAGAVEGLEAVRERAQRAFSTGRSGAENGGQGALRLVTISGISAFDGGRNVAVMARTTG